MDDAAGDSAVLAEVRQRLKRKFTMLEAAVIDEVVGESWRNFDGCRIRVYLPILVERAASVRLHTLAALISEHVQTEDVRSEAAQGGDVRAVDVRVEPVATESVGPVRRIVPAVADVAVAITVPG